MTEPEHPSPAARRDWVGRRLDGRYVVERVLGAGGMATVYLARDERMDREVVVKVPHARLLDDPEFRARFAKEIRALTKLSMSHIVRALDTGEEKEIGRGGVEETTPFVVLEYLEGRSLEDRLSESTQSPDEVLAWLADVAEALDFIHARGIVHRDVKPGNILFDRAGKAVVSDFGIAKALGSMDTGLTQTGGTPGSPDYMAPEVALGGAIGGSYDQYALAVVVYEALAGTLPHETAETPFQVIYRKTSLPPRALSETAPHVPPPVAAAVLRGLERDPAKRFASCKAFATAFAEASRSGHATRGSTVEAKASTAKKDVSPPDVVGLPRASAEAAIRAAGFTCMVIEVQVGPHEPVGVVIRRSPVFGSGVIQLVVSRRDVTASSPRMAARAGDDGRRAVGGEVTEDWPVEVERFLANWATPAGPDRDRVTGYPKRIRRMNDEMTMVLIPSGTFWMGAVFGDPDARRSELPRHAVTLSKSYYMDEHPVTNTQFMRILESRGLFTARAVAVKDSLRFGRGQHPVVSISWDEAREFARWVGASLPTEAQFERALRGGVEGKRFAWGDDFPPPAQTGNYGEDVTMPVRAFAPNPFGLYDMSGNVWEWCDNAYYDYAETPVRDPAGPVRPVSSPKRVLRGGSNCYPRELSASYRYVTMPELVVGLFGFRCAKALP